jgi:hypothetical protein
MLRNTGVSVHPPAYEDYLKALGGYRSTLYCELRRQPRRAASSALRWRR